MAQKGKRVCLQVEWIEPKQLLSSSLMGGLAQTPVLTMFRYSSTLAGVEKAVGTVAKTHEFSGLAPSLATLSARLPFGRQQVLPVWNNDLNIFDPNIRGSGLAMQRQLLSDTRVYVQSGATEGLFRVIGRGSSVFYRDDPAVWVNVLINRKPPEGTQYNFAVATVTNGTGSNLYGNVEVQAKVESGKPYETDKMKFNMTNKCTYLMYLAYPQNKLPGNVVYILYINNKPLPTTIPAQTYTNKNWTEFTGELEKQRNQDPKKVPSKTERYELYINSSTKKYDLRPKA